MTIVRWKPFGDLMDWSDEVERRMTRLFGERQEQGFVWAPRADIKETDKELVVIAEIPGMDKKDISVTMNEGVLAISGEKKSEERAEGENWHRVERVSGRFERSFYIPREVDEGKITASYKDGVLRVVVPKKEQPKPKAIPVEVK